MTAVAEQADTSTVIPAADGQLLEEAAMDAGHTVTEWTRTPEQEQIVADYLAMIDQQYTQNGADPRLVALLTDITPIGSGEMCAMLGYEDKKKAGQPATTRLYQLFTKQRRLQEADQVPHPSALPDGDANGGKRGPREIRGVARGRMVHWILQSCRGWWNPITGQVVLQTGINAGGAPRTGPKRKT